MNAYAVLIIPGNLNAIASEKPDFDFEETMQWLEQHEVGYFLRDEESVLDCKYFEEMVFFEMYAFEEADDGSIFRRVVKL